MRILVDSRMMYMSGIGRYIRQLLSAMSRLDQNVNFDLLGDGIDFRQFLNETELDRLRFCHHNYTPSIYGLREQLAGSMQMLKFTDSDIVHIPHYNTPWLLPAGSVVTVHDLIHFKLPQFQNPFRLTAARQVLKNAVKKAARIIVVSDATAADLISMFPEIRIERKIRRIYLGVSEVFRALKPSGVECFKTQHHLEKYILYVGNRLPHKNLGRLARAVAKLQPCFPGLKLVVAGNRLRKQDELDKIKSSIKTDTIIEWGPANDRELVALYSGAKALLLPSLCEGFGLPALEAMACGLPVVVSNTGSLTEVVGEAGIYVNPYEVDDIARGIYQVMADADLCSRLSVLGFEQAARFRWQDTAQQTLNVYHEVLQ